MERSGRHPPTAATAVVVLFVPRCFRRKLAQHFIPRGVLQQLQFTVYTAVIYGNRISYMSCHIVRMM